MMIVMMIITIIVMIIEHLGDDKLENQQSI